MIFLAYRDFALLTLAFTRLAVTHASLVYIKMLYRIRGECLMLIDIPRSLVINFDLISLPQI